MRYEHNKTIISILGGIGEIGGNLIEIKYGSERIILDLGYSFKKFKSLYEWPTRIPHGINEMLETGLAPKINGLYTRWVEDGLKPDVDYGKDTDILGAFITHGHYDHIGLLTQLNRNIPAYMGEATSIITRSRIETSQVKRYNNYDYIDIRTFRSFKGIHLGSFYLLPIHVDHSIPGAYGFIIETPDTTILYTGDYRLHGQEKSLTNDLIDKAMEYEIDYLITEGTRVHDTEDISEMDVYRKLYNIFSQTDNPIFIEASYLDIDRIRSIVEAAKATDKKMVITLKHFLYLYNLFKFDPKLRLDIKPEESYILSIRSRRKIFREFKSMLEKEGYNIIYREDLSISNKTIYLDFTSYIQELLRKDIRQGAIAIFSNSEPFDEESYIDFNKIINWLNLFSIPSYRIHSSGHASPLDIKKVVDTIRPRNIIVIHSEYPNTLKRFLGYK